MTHEELARLNFKLARSGGEEETAHPGFEWRVTMHFYAAVHAVNHVLFGGGEAPRNFDHVGRWQRMESDPRFASLLDRYEELEKLSRQARYKPTMHPMVLGEYLAARNHAKQILETLGLSTKK